MTLNDVKAVCKELKLVCKPHSSDIKDLYIYTSSNDSDWIACYYHSFAEAVIYHSSEPLFSDKDEFMKGLKRKLKAIKEESIKERIKSLEKDFV